MLSAYAKAKYPPVAVHKGFVWLEHGTQVVLRLMWSILFLLDISFDANRFIIVGYVTDLGISTILSQEAPPGEVVIAYTTLTLESAELKCIITRKELLFTVRCIYYLRSYLLGKPSKFRTDHHLLQWTRFWRTWRSNAEITGETARIRSYLWESSRTETLQRWRTFSISKKSRIDKRDSK